MVYGLMAGGLGLTVGRGEETGSQGKVDPAKVEQTRKITSESMRRNDAV